MTKRTKSSFDPRACLAGVFASALVAVWSADAEGAMTHNSDRGSGGAFNWLDQLGPNGPKGDSPLPGGFSVENGEEDPPPDYRSHSDVPDLPDSGQSTSGNGPESSNSGSNLYRRPSLPGLADVLFGNGFGDNPVQPHLPLTPDAGNVHRPDAPGGAQVPSPGTLVVAGLAVLAAGGRRRR